MLINERKIWVPNVFENYLCRILCVHFIRLLCYLSLALGERKSAVIILYARGGQYIIKPCMINWTHECFLIN